MEDIKQAFEQLSAHGYELPYEINISVPDSENTLQKAGQYFYKNFQWLPEYKEVAKWLADNQGKGLFLYGANGRGKTILSKVILPVIIYKYAGKIIKRYDAQEMNENLEDILKKRIVSLDDIGTEEIRVIYGEKRWAFPEIMDKTEKNKNLTIITTNLDASGIEAKYGIRTIERIKATCKRVVFKGNSLR